MSLELNDKCFDTIVDFCCGNHEEQEDEDVELWHVSHGACVRAIRTFRTACEPSALVPEGTVLKILERTADESMLLVDCDLFAAKQWLDKDCLVHVENLFEGPLPDSVTVHATPIAANEADEYSIEKTPGFDQDTDTEDSDAVIADTYYFFQDAYRERGAGELFACWKKLSRKRAFRREVVKLGRKNSLDVKKLQKNISKLTSLLKETPSNTDLLIDALCRWCLDTKCRNAFVQYVNESICAE